ncbi:hypothetical protein B0J14DRAFT_493326, partial [Halenospora varia]
KVECSVCGESVHPYATVRLVCSDVYCKPCLKSFFLRVAKDESLFPPKCHRQPIDISTIEADFLVEELTAYRSAELEFTSTDRVYCADPECAKFIPMPQRTSDCASCKACSAGTCMHYKALAHDGGCLAYISLIAVLHTLVAQITNSIKGHLNLPSIYIDTR